MLFMARLIQCLAKDIWTPPPFIRRIRCQPASSSVYWYTSMSTISGTIKRQTLNIITLANRIKTICLQYKYPALFGMVVSGVQLLLNIKSATAAPQVHYICLLTAQVYSLCSPPPLLFQDLLGGAFKHLINFKQQKFKLQWYIQWQYSGQKELGSSFKYGNKLPPINVVLRQIWNLQRKFKGKSVPNWLGTARSARVVPNAE